MADSTQQILAENLSKALVHGLERLTHKTQLIPGIDDQVTTMFASGILVAIGAMIWRRIEKPAIIKKIIDGYEGKKDKQ